MLSLPCPHEHERLCPAPAAAAASHTVCHQLVSWGGQLVTGPDLARVLGTKLPANARSTGTPARCFEGGRAGQKQRSQQNATPWPQLAPAGVCNKTRVQQKSLPGPHTGCSGCWWWWGGEPGQNGPWCRCIKAAGTTVMRHACANQYFPPVCGHDLGYPLPPPPPPEPGAVT